MLNCVTLFVNSKNNKEQQEDASTVGYLLDIAISITDNEFKLKSLYSRKPLKTANLPTCSVKEAIIISANADRGSVLNNTLVASIDFFSLFRYF